MYVHTRDVCSVNNISDDSAASSRSVNYELHHTEQNRNEHFIAGEFTASFIVIHRHTWLDNAYRTPMHHTATTALVVRIYFTWCLWQPNSTARVFAMFYLHFLFLRRQIFTRTRNYRRGTLENCVKAPQLD